MKRRFTCLILVFSILGPCKICTAQVSSGVRVFDTFRNAYVNAIVNRNLNSLTTLYDSTNQELIDRTRREYGDLFSLEPDSIEVRFGEVEVLQNRWTVPVFQRSSYVLNNVPQTRAGWSTLVLERLAGRLQIVGDDTRDYLQPTHTDLSVQLFPDSGLMSGSCIIQLEVTQSGEDNIILSMNRGLDVARLAVNGEISTDFIRRATTIEITISKLEVSQSPVSVEVDFTGTLFNESEHAGFSQVHIGPEGSFASWVTDWYPRNGSGPTKSPGQIQITAPAGLAVISNGRALPPEYHDDQATHTFLVNVPQDYTFAAGDYFHQSTEVDGVQLGVYFLEGGPDKVDLYLTKCAALLRFQMSTYGRYPFGSYLLVEIPSSATGNLGGSSEQGMNLYPTGMLSPTQFNLPLLSHELGHSWWGNWVRSADGAVISEGLAQYTAVMSVEHFLGQDAMRKFLKKGFPSYPQSAEMYFEHFGGPTSDDIPMGIVSAAGASTLHTLADTKGHFVYQMLSEKIGRDAFMRGLRRAIDEFGNKEMHLTDLFRIWEQESGMDLTTFRDQWFYRTGAPDFAMSYQLGGDKGNTIVKGTITQKGDVYEDDAEVAVYTGKSRELHEMSIADRQTQFEFTVGGTVDSVIFDPDYKIFRYTPPFRLAYLLGKGTQERVRGANDSAIVTLTAYLGYFPRSLRGHYQRARAIQNSGDESRAIAAFDSVLILFNDGVDYSWPVPWTYYNLGKLYLATGDTTTAISKLNETFEYSDEARACAQSRALLDSLGQ